MQQRVRSRASSIAPAAALAALAAFAALGCRRDDAAPAPAPAAAAPATTPAAHRVVSLTPSATEVVAALGSTAQLVGVDEYSSFPPEVAGLPKVGSFLSPNLEIIVGLKPTVVIVDDVHSQAA